MGRATRSRHRFSRVCINLAILIILSLLVPAVALADEEHPALMQVSSVHIYRHLLEDDDFCLVALYNCAYDDELPGEPMDKLFLFRLLDGVDELGTNTPFPYINYGYGLGCISLYWTALEAPDWGDEYDLLYEGNPTKFDDPAPFMNYLVQESDYIASDDADDQKLLLRNHVLYLAGEMQDLLGTEYQMALNTDVGIVLSSLGEAYFRGAIPGLQDMCPELFIVQTVDPEYTSRTWGEEQVDIYPATVTGAGETTATLELTFPNYPGDHTGMTVDSSIEADTPAATAYDSKTQEVTIGGLDPSNTRTLEVTYRYNPLAEQFASRWNGTWVESVKGVGELFGGMAWQTATTLIVLALLLGLVYACFRVYKTADPALMLGFLLMLGTWEMGFFMSLVLGIVCMMCALVIGYLLIFRGTGG